MSEFKRFFETRDMIELLIHYYPVFGDSTLFIDFLMSIRRNDKTRLLELLSEPNAALEVREETGETLLHLASRFGCIELVNSIIKLGADINIQDIRGYTPCYRATVRSIEMVRLFLDNGADINIADSEEITPLQRALLSGSIEVVMLLWDHQFYFVRNLNRVESDRINSEACREVVQFFQDMDIDVSCNGYQTLLHFVGIYGDEETFKQVLSRCVDIDINAKSPDTHTLLHVLVDAGRINLVRMILEYGTDVNDRGSFENTALHYAAMRNNPEMVRLLLDHKADVVHKDDKDGTAINSVILIAIRLQNKEIIDMMLTAGADINMEIILSYKFRTTVLLEACGGSLEYMPRIPKFALNYSNNQDLMNRCGSSLDLIQFLIERGADIEAKNSDGMTPILIACNAGRLDVVKLLLNLGAKLDHVDGSRNDALSHAVAGNNMDLLRFLLCNGFDIRTRKSNNSLMHGFYLSRHDDLFDMVEFIVDNGGDIGGLFSKRCLPCYIRETFRWEPEMTLSLLELKPTVKISMWIGKDSPYRYSYDIHPCSLQQFIAFLALEGADITLYKDDLSDDKIFSASESFYEKCKLEIQEMKRMKICDGKRVTYLDFLDKELLDVVPFTNGEELMEVLKAGGYKQEFPCYAFMLEQRINRVKRLRNYVDLIKKFLQKVYFKKTLPVVVLGKIFSFWNVGDVRNFGRAFCFSYDI